MTFHLASGRDNKNRVGEFVSIAEAMASGMLQAATGRDFPAFIVEAEGTTGGTLVAGFDHELGWVKVDAEEEVPEWWEKLSDSTKSALLASPRARLTPELRQAVLHAHGPLVKAYWVEQGTESGEFDFAMATRDWLMRRSIIERF